jgi:hypothetical protein
VMWANSNPDDETEAANAKYTISRTSKGRLACLEVWPSASPMGLGWFALTGAFG